MLPVAVRSKASASMENDLISRSAAKEEILSWRPGIRKPQCLFCVMVFMYAAVLAVCTVDSCTIMTFAAKENGGVNDCLYSYFMPFDAQ